MNILTNTLRDIAARHGYYIRKMDGLSPLETVLYSRLAQAPDFFFVQIGANDGVLCDQIHPFITRFQLAGLAVEPIPDLFEALQRTYRNYPRVKPVNVALHRTATRATIYRADPADTSLPSSTRGTASFDREHLRHFNIPDASILPVEVPCITLHQLLDQHAVRHVDLLQIDTEGYDIEIVKMIDFSRVKPSVIRFEHGLPDEIVSWDDLQSILRYLHGHGYLFMLEPYDVIAYQPAPWSRVNRATPPKTAP
jgi:FkbM family methyltransferase